MRPPYTRSDPGYEPRNTAGVWRGFGWFIVPEWNITIAAPPKCGSSSLKQFFYMQEMNDVRMVNRHEINPNSDIYYVVRNPYDRFVSLWKSKCRDKAAIMDRTVYGMNPQELINHIVAGNEDVHWTPQTQLIGNLDATVIPLEMLSWWWHESGFGSLGIYNATEGEPEMSDDLKRRILTFYADDLKLYHKAQCDLCWETVRKIKPQQNQASTKTNVKSIA